MFAQARQHFHVALPTLDLFIEDNAVEPLPALGQFLGEIEMGAGNKAESIDVLLHHVFGFLDPFGNLDLLLTSEQWDLAHLLEIHPHRII